MINRNRSVIAGIVLSASALVGLVVHEGYSDTAIIPVPGDKWTIGFGTTDGIVRGDRITPPKALARALTDIQKYEGVIKQCVTVPLHQYEYDAYVSLAYNIGPTAFCRKADKRRKTPDGTPNPEPDRLNDVLNAGNYAEACRRILTFDKFKGKPLRGLTIRRQAEYKQCMGEQT